MFCCILGILSVGLKNERRRKYFAHLRFEADADVKLLNWTFEALKYPVDRRLTFKGDPRDVDKVTHFLLDAVHPLVGLWTETSSVIEDEDVRDLMREKLGPLSLDIPDDRDGSRSFWKQWLMELAHEITPVYRFLEQNAFTWPPGGMQLQFITTDDEVPYIRHK
ncbi:hypothetical protein AAVH_37661 [Aphelenchoides avenae]|nr:hypothetical protein AAVH_37661 [Aphelenchus avenae]